MNQSKKLDEILEAFAAAKLKRDYNEENNTGNTLIDTCNAFNIELVEGEEKILEAILLDGGNIEYIDNRLKYLLRISNKGVNFINSGGYQQLDIENEKKEKENELKLKQIKSTISTNLWTKIGISLSVIISLIALVLSIITIIKRP